MTGDAYRFVVVLCSHNGAGFIEEQINSILQQNGRIDRIHVHDFASTDGTTAILARLEQRHGDRICVALHPDAPGALQSFVRALRLVAPALDDNALVFLADQDDVWLPNKLETVTQVLAERRLSPATPFVLFHDVKVVDGSLQVMRPTYYTGNPFQVPRDLHFTRLVLANPAIGHTMLISVPLLRLLVAWPDTERYLMHDWLAALIASRLGRIEYIPQALSLYRQHDSNVLGAYRKRRISPARLLRFTDNLVIQAGALAQATRDLSARHGSAGQKISPVERLCRHGYRRGALALAATAFARGPTWQRKAIGVLLLIRAIVGPSARKVEVRS